MKDLVTVVLAVFIILIVLIFLFLIYVLVHKPDTQDSVLIVQGGLNQTCYFNSSCDDGLSCDSNTVVCKANEDQSCINSYDCITGLTCSGRCVSGKTGSLLDYCPCNIGLICQLDNDGYKRCYGGDNTACTTNAQCAFDYTCINSRCQFQKAVNSYPCNANADCESNNCSLGYCQNSNIVSHNIGSSCIGTCQQSIFRTSECNASLECNCDLNGGTCIIEDAPLMNTCNSANTIQCLTSINSICSNINFQTCSGSDTRCTCKVDASSTTSTCIPGTMLDIGMCFNAISIPCNIDQQCFSGTTCTGPSRIAYYTFTYIDNSTGYINPYNATSIQLSSFDGPATTTMTKMFCNSVNTIDSLYICSTDGLWYTTFNPTSGLLVTTWSLIINNDTSRGQFIDAAYIYNIDAILCIFRLNNIYYMYVYENNQFTTWPSNTDGSIRFSANSPVTNVYKVDINFRPTTFSISIIADNGIILYLNKDTNYFNTFQVYSQNYIMKSVNTEISNIVQNNEYSFLYLTLTDNRYQIEGINISPVNVIPTIPYIYSIDNMDLYTPKIYPDEIIMILNIQPTQQSADNVIYIVYSNLSTPLQYYATKDTIVSCSNNSYYILDKASCVGNI